MKTYDEKREAFDRMLEGRLPKAVKAIELLSNLSRKGDYAWTNAQLQSMIDQLDDAVDGVMKAFGVETTADEPKSEAVAPAPFPEPRATVSVSAAVDGFDKTRIKKAYLRIASGDRVHGMRDLRGVILGWGSHLMDDFPVEEEA